MIGPWPCSDCKQPILFNGASWVDPQTMRRHLCPDPEWQFRYFERKMRLLEMKRERTRV